MKEKSTSIIKEDIQREVIQPAGMEKLKFEVSQEMGIKAKTKNEKN